MTTVSEEAVNTAEIIQVITDLRMAILQDDDEGLAEHAEPMAKAKALISKLAALPHLPGVGVKKLEWELVSGDYYAEGAGTHYNIYQTKPDLWNSVTVRPGNVRLATNVDLEAAKAAAQADYEARILSAIEPSAPDMGNPITLTYTNYRGETSERTITPIRPWFGSTEWHPEPQWLLRAYDHDKGAERDFALKDFGRQEPSAARELALEEVVETLEYVDRMFRLDLSKYIDWDGDDFNQAIFDTHQRVKKALRTLSSPDHADAGKVEGDGNRETLWKSAARDFGAYLASNGTPYAIDYWNECFGPLFSAASEGAE